MKLELKSIKHFEANSEETHCFSAKLYVDGKHLFDIRNDGHGGCDYVDPTKKIMEMGNWQEKLEEVEAYCRSLKPAEIHTYGDKTITLENTLEIWTCDRVNDFLVLKDIKSELRKGLLTLEEGDLRVYRVAKERRTDSYLSGLKSAIREKKQGVIFFDELSEDKQLELFRQHAG